MPSAKGEPAVCLIGWPAAHSRSPIIHNHWLKTLGLSGVYRIEAVKPEALADFVQRLHESYIGANVTIPHKEQALALSQPDERARAVGAANTLWFDGGVLRSTNTDIEGFLNNLDARAPGWDRDLKEALVLGAGGSSRAVVFGLLERGVGVVHVANRTLARAQALRDSFGSRVAPAAWDEIPSLLRRAGLLVNTTSLGMAGQPALEIDVAALPSQAVVAELVYVPLETPLLRASRLRGLRHADGLGMLLHQAVRGFSLWFGTKPDVTSSLREQVEADLLK
jgi:shikimate dehydrogenase